MPSLCYLIVLTPLCSFFLAFTPSSSRCMRECPSKNDPLVLFPGRNSLRTLCLGVLCRSLVLAIGSFSIGIVSGSERHGPVLVQATLAISSIASSVTFCSRTLPFWQERVWYSNVYWFRFAISSLLLLLVLVLLNVALAEDNDDAGLRIVKDDDARTVVTWLLFVAIPIIVCAIFEVIKRWDRKVHERAERLRRLQFETRLGMWSPR